MARRLTVLSGGHPFEEESFAELLATLNNWDVEHLRHPDAEQQVADGAIDDADAVLFYDMPGYNFADGAVTVTPPSEAFKEKLRAYFASGRGAVAMHHAIAGWALWPEWSEWVGGRFLYQAGEVRGQPKPDSGYRHDIEYTASILTDHPVTRGVPKQFAMTDEVYLAEIFTDQVTPLVASDYRYTRGNFYSAALAVAGQMFSRDGWAHEDGSNLVGWVSRAINAPLVYLQFGDGPAAYENAHCQRLLANALEFVSEGEKQ